jgi:hypothetical protein
MRCFRNVAGRHPALAQLLRARQRKRPTLEELETRTLPSTIAGYSPAQILQAYGINQLANSQPGFGTTIAIVDAYQSPQIQADLTKFDAQYGLPAINLTVVNDGAKRSDPTGGWQLETALDVEWAHAVAPYARIVLVEAANDNVSAAGVPTALLHAVSVASSQPGVDVVSMSWGTPEFRSETQYDSYFNKPGITFLAASGDSGAGTIWPAVSPNVVAVGGTTLNLSSSGTYLSETAWGNGGFSSFWGGSGGGVSQYESQPSYQKSGYVTSVTSGQDPGGMRTSPDVAYLGDPNTGVAVYDKSNGGWLEIGGTSAGTPQWAALVALADQVRAGSSQAPLSSLQTLTSLYQEQGDFHDITTGNNGGYSAQPGYDLVTGLGTPEANLLVPDLAAGKSAPATITTPPPGTGTTNGHHHHHWWFVASASSVSVPATTAVSASVTPAEIFSLLSASSTEMMTARPSQQPLDAVVGPPARAAAVAPPVADLVPQTYSSGSSVEDLAVQPDRDPEVPEAPALPPDYLPGPPSAPRPTPDETTTPEAESSELAASGRASGTDNQRGGKDRAPAALGQPARDADTIALLAAAILGLPLDLDRWTESAAPSEPETSSKSGDGERDL